MGEVPLRELSEQPKSAASLTSQSAQQPCVGVDHTLAAEPQLVNLRIVS